MKKALSLNLPLLVNRRYSRGVSYVIFKPGLFISPFFFFPQDCQQSMVLIFEVGDWCGRWVFGNDIVAYQHNDDPQINITRFSNRAQQCTTVQHVQRVKKLKIDSIGVNKERHPLWAPYLKTMIVRLGLKGVLPLSCATGLIQRLQLRNL